MGRETGFTVEFATADAEELARETILIGAVESDPRSELRLRMLTVDLDAEFDQSRSVMVITQSR